MLDRAPVIDIADATRSSRALRARATKFSEDGRSSLLLLRRRREWLLLFLLLLLLLLLMMLLLSLLVLAQYPRRLHYVSISQILLAVCWDCLSAEAHPVSA